MPTTRPRYTFTDAGEVADMLDVAARRWPDQPRGKELLVRLAAIGREVVSEELQARAGEGLRERQREALADVPTLVDADLLLGDAAWR